MENVVTTPETNVITTAQMSKAREIDFALRFSGNGALAKLIEVLGVTRKIPLIEGTTMNYYKTTGTLQSGAVPEGEIIPLSQYQREKIPVGEITLKKWRKATTAEAILKSGYDEAVRATDNKLLKDVQNGIRADFFTYLTGIVVAAQAASGTEGQPGYTPAVAAVGTTVTDSTLQGVIAKTWGNLQVLFEDDTADIVHFINPLTISDYLRAANITLQTAFGFSYVENFLGMGMVIMNSRVPVNEVYSTAKDNLIMYYIPVTADAMKAFQMTVDESGYVGIKSGYPTEERAQVETLVMSGIQFLVEYADGVVKGVISNG